MNRAALRTLRTVISAAALWWAAVVGAQTTPARDTPKPTGTSAIRGRVLAGDSGQPLRRAIVSASSAADQRHTWNALSDANGRFEIRGLPAGSFFIAATKTNYLRAVLGQQRFGVPGKPIEVAAGQMLGGVDVLLTKTAVITGRVVDELNEPVGNAQVALMRYQFIQNARRLMPAGRQATTDESGNYRLFGLQPGDYYISASLRNFAMLGGNDDQTAYTPTYYPGTPVASQAQKIAITPGQTLNEFNFTLLPARASRISGTVVDSLGQPMANARVVVTNPPGPGGGSMSSGTVKADGSFTVGGLAPGEYILRVGTNAGAESAAVPVHVTGDDIMGLQLITAPPSVIRGHVTAGDASPRLTGLRVTAQSMTELPGGATSDLKADGSFELKMPPGRVALRVVGNMGSLRLRTVRMGDADVTDSGFDVPVNATLENILIELTSKVTQVNGTVTNAAGEKTRETWVVLFASDPDRWTFQSRFLARAVPAPNLIFNARVAPGEYLAAALPGDVDRSRWNDPDFLGLLRDRATPLSISEGETKTLDLKIVEAPVQ